MPLPDTVPPSSEPAWSVDLGAWPVLDAAHAIALLDHSTALYLEVARAFQSELTELPARLGAILQAETSASLRTLHTYKGLALTVGAQQLSEVCRQCERMLKAGAPVASDASLQAAMRSSLEASIQATLAQLQSTLGALADAQQKP